MLLVAFLANARMHPFQSRGVSNLEDGALFSLLLTLAAAISFRDPETSATDELVLAWTLILGNAIFCLIAGLYVTSTLKNTTAGKRAMVPLARLLGSIRNSTNASTPEASISDTEL